MDRYRKFFCVWGMAWLVLLFLSCGPENSNTLSSRAGVPTQPVATPASLETRNIQVGGKSVTAEIADNDETRSKGLMFRKSMEENSGMLFVFEEPRYLKFYMKNTYIPLSIAFIKPDGTIESIQDMEPLNEEKRYFPKYKALYALEMNQGWFEKNGVTAGDHVEIPKEYRPHPQ